MNVEVGAEAALFPEKEYINGIAFAVCDDDWTDDHYLSWSLTCSLWKTHLMIIIKMETISDLMIINDLRWSLAWQLSPACVDDWTDDYHLPVGWDLA